VQSRKCRLWPLVAVGALLGSSFVPHFE